MSFEIRKVQEKGIRTRGKLVAEKRGQQFPVTRKKGDCRGGERAPRTARIGEKGRE